MKTFILNKLVFISCLLAFLSTDAQPGAGDCPGLLVCADVASATVVNGSVNELNAANRGCLAASEATASYWFQVCISTSGTLAFIIDPSGTNNDYDFAVWGPNSPCPPTNAPIRCSYDATPVGGPNNDQTGLSATNPYNGNPEFDTSEGATGGDGFVIPINALVGECYVIGINNYAGGSNTFSLDFTGTAGLICSALPIELLSFECKSAGDEGIVLSWSTASEINNDYFKLERSSEGTDFQTIKIIDGQGNSTLTTHYMETDASPVSGVNYYRLTQVDFDSTKTSSYVVSCTSGGDEVVTMNVFDLSGRMVISEKTMLSEKMSSINNSGISPGIYIVHLIRSSGRTTLEKCVKKDP